MSVPVPLTVAERFALSLDGLRKEVAARIAGGRMAAAMIVLVWQRLQHIEGHVLRLLARFQQGRISVRTVGAPRVGSSRTGGGSAALPRGFAWLLVMVPYQAACFAGQIRTVLAEPEMVEFLIAVPQARRVLGPLCRMLGIEAAVLTPRRAPRAEAGSGVEAAPDAALVVEAQAACGDVTVRFADPPLVAETAKLVDRLPSDGLERCRIGSGVAVDASSVSP
jgi:hypothetical protein